MSNKYAVELDICFIKAQMRLAERPPYLTRKVLVVEVTVLWLNPCERAIRVWRLEDGYKSTVYGKMEWNTSQYLSCE